jgi:hypothetical protein
MSRWSFSTNLKESNFPLDALRLISVVTERGAARSSLWGTLQGHPWLARSRTSCPLTSPEGTTHIPAWVLWILVSRAKKPRNVSGVGYKKCRGDSGVKNVNPFYNDLL